MTEREKCANCGVRPVANKDGEPVCALAEITLCLGVFCQECRTKIRHTCGWIDPKEVTAALAPYLMTYRRPNPSEVHGELLSVGIISDNVEIRTLNGEKEGYVIEIRFPRTDCVFTIPWNRTWKGTPFGSWVPVKIWEEERARERAAQRRVHPEVAKFWTGV